MKCPHCKKEFSYAQIQHMIGPHMDLASDGSYINVATSCPFEGCEGDIEFYFPLTEINQEKV